MKTRIPSRNAMKRAARFDRVTRYEMGYTQSEAALDAINYARRMLRTGQTITSYPDCEDFFGVRLSDSTTGYRYVRAYDEALERILNRFALWKRAEVQS